jgi:hypothetical protein
MAFFRQFPKTTYDFEQNGIDTTIVDLFRFIKIDETFFDDLATYEYYDIKDGDRPDIVSNALYGTPEYYWTFFLCNDDLKNGLSSWPMSQSEFETYMDTEYSGIVIQTAPQIQLTSTLDSFEDTSLAGKFNLFDRFVPTENRDCTLTVSNNLVTLISHGLINGTRVNFQSIVDTTGVISSKTYYVINTQTNTFQISLIEGGAVVNFTGLDGTAKASVQFQDIKRKSVYVDGEIIKGTTSGAEAFLAGKDVQLSQLILRNTSGTFRELPPEEIVGQTSGNKVRIDKIFERRLAPHHYETFDGKTIYDPRSIPELQPEYNRANLKLVTNLEEEIRLNDARERIKVVNPKAIYRFAQTYKKILNA